MKHDVIKQARGTGRRMERLPEVMSKVGLKRSAIYELIKQGKFPAPINLGPRAVAWISDETETWIDERIAASRTSAGGR